MMLQSHDGAIHLLPAIPDNWPTGEITGLVARGGFVLDMAWKNNKLIRLKVKSKIGGKCRLRINKNMELKNRDLQLAKGLNTNPFYETPQVKAPIISSQAKLKPVGVKTTIEYDIDTDAGMEYVFNLN
ncbi:hypothetical protein D3C87_1624360 [compost metagenome]